jgi:hypothetical protein
MSKKVYPYEEDGGTNTAHMLGISEHTVVRVMAGDIETLRKRLCDAIEELGYRVMSENPLRAKHGARGSGTYYMSANALDYPTTLEIGFRQQSAGSTRVTFEYQVVHGHYGKGDRQTLTREAEAIIALAAQRAAVTNCLVCGADFLGDSRFCRRCGAPAISAIPAEIEVLRLTANVRAGHQWTGIGAVFLAIGTLLPAISLLTNNLNGAKALLIISLFFALMGWWGVLAGFRRTHLTLNPRNSEEDNPTRPSFKTPRVPNTNELNDGSPGIAPSITEATTGLLPESVSPEQEAVPLYRKREKEES